MIIITANEKGANVKFGDIKSSSDCVCTMLNALVAVGQTYAKVSNQDDKLIESLEELVGLAKEVVAGTVVIDKKMFGGITNGRN